MIKLMINQKNWGKKLCIYTAQVRLCLGAGEVGSCIQMTGVPI